MQILGVNEVGHESGNDSFCEGRDLPWLQDTDEAAVWAAWGVEYRDVVVLDAAGAVYDVYNLTEHDLGDDTNFAALEALLTDAAQAR